jgi:AAA family ATP:ADP antiporter
MLAATLMIAQHIAGKATRDALFLTHFEVSHLPKVMMLGAAVSVAAVLLMSRLLPRYGPARLMPPLYLASTLLLGVQWFLADLMPQAAAVALYIHVSALNSILISGFWSVINERFDPYAAKKIIPKLTAATTFGGLLGGLAAKTVAEAVDTHAILLMLSAMHLICAGAVAYLGQGQSLPPAKADGPPDNLLMPLKRSPLIRRMALLALLVATTAAVLD